MNGGKFDKLVEEHQRQLYTTAYRLTGSRDDALDLAQETFLNAWKARTQLRDLHPPDFSDPGYIQGSDSATLQRVLSLFRDLPQHDPGSEWFNKATQTLKNLQ